MAATDLSHTASTSRGRELALRLASEHASSMLAVARRYSLCADDAHDACQRAFEILLRRADTLDPEGAAAWLRTVVKHEALAVGAARRRLVGPSEVDLDFSEARELTPADERVVDGERTDRSAEALARLKPQEVRALVLKARGYSYKEIAQLTGWTYTKVNRCITEGRRAFLDRYAEIEAGRECERWAAALSALADGEASSEDVTALRPHLRHCAVCRARLREFRAAPSAVAAMALPAGAAIEPEDGHAGLLSRLWETVAGGAHERLVLTAHKLQAGIEAVSATKVAAVAASATALAGGAAGALHAGPDGARRAAHTIPSRTSARVATREDRAPDRSPPAARGVSPSPPARPADRPEVAVEEPPVESGEFTPAAPEKTTTSAPAPSREAAPPRSPTEFAP